MAVILINLAVGDLAVGLDLGSTTGALSGPVSAVVAINLLLALGGFYLAMWLWQLRRSLAQVSHSLDEAERNTYNALHGAPEAIALGQTGTRELRDQLQRSGSQLRRLRQVVGLIATVRNLGMGRAPNAKAPKAKAPKSAPIAPSGRR
jgi:hypothetical protein